MRKQVTREDAEAIRQEIDARHGYPRKLSENEVVRFGGGIHVAEVWDLTAVAINGDGPEVEVIVADADERHIEPTRRARLRAAKEPVEETKDPEGKR